MEKFKIKYKNLTREVQKKDTASSTKGHGVEGKFFPEGIILYYIILYFILFYFIILYYT